MTDHKSLAATGRRLVHPLEKALTEGRARDFLAIMREFGVPASWDFCCETFDKKVEDKHRLVELAFALVKAVEAGLIGACRLRELCLTLLTSHLVFNSQWRENRTIQVLTVAIDAHPTILDSHFQQQVIMAALRSESIRLFCVAGLPMQSLEPTPDLMFALCEGRGTLLDVVFTPVNTWSDSEKMRMITMFTQIIIQEKAANETQETFLGTLYDRGIESRLWINPQTLKSASVRNIVHARKIELSAEDVLGVPLQHRLEFCMAGLISPADAKIKDRHLEEALGEDIGL
ncbi:hypothetical protein [Pseudomonas sp. Leaf58]|uniref:hypothetical protein n=1 Tax=Pseudomonas sp. Leaf58 TaxID=1736226 RepID=UPI000B0E3085|nr:hypothetical protein [Pseudomonas sp. Leaf58]